MYICTYTYTEYVYTVRTVIPMFASATLLRAGERRPALALLEWRVSAKVARAEMATAQLDVFGNK